ARTYYARHPVQQNHDLGYDSGFEEDFQSPSPSNFFTIPWSVNLNNRLIADHHEVIYDESCFIIQKNNEEEFLALNCLARQPQITAEARCKLVSWLIAVYKHFKLSFESCCLAVNIMDRFLVTTSVAADCFQLLGVTSLLIATKHVEVCSPRIKQLLSLCCNAFSKEQLCNLECLILLRLNFRLAAPTLAFFLDYLVTTEEDQLSRVEKYKYFACKICELSLADYAFNKYQPSVIVQNLLCTADHNSINYSLIQQCTEDLRLLVSLNLESLQDLKFLLPLQFFQTLARCVCKV
uniref:Cyclin-like domain-containing protein n=1 Tax=Electrophorus electricus TaxID=8005 RepID=A0A4W4HKG3_ELEEL